MSKKPVAVVDNESATKPGDRIRVLRRFNTVKEAEEWVGNRPDKAKLDRGGYGIDAPEELINPPTGPDLTTDINCGFYGITVNTKAAREWFAENVQTEGWQWLGNTLGIDNGNIFAAIVDGAQAAGLEVE